MYYNWLCSVIMVKLYLDTFLCHYYLNHLAPVFLCRLESEYKLGKAYRYFSCDFVREVFYFELNSTDLYLEVQSVTISAIKQ